MQKMSQTFASIALMVIVSLPLQAKQPPIMAAPPIVALMPVLNDSPDFFDLSAEQKKQVANIAQRSSHAREGLDQSILDLRAELRDLLMQQGVDAKQVQKISAELLTQEKARLQLSIDCAMGLQKVLTPAQWKVLLDLAQQ
jgi:Spy/CpxP family protein refolding chaperone